MYDLLIKGGRVIDPALDTDGLLDVAIKQDKIAKIAKDIPSQEGHEVVDANGKIIVPGLIDLHCHIYHGTLANGLEPDVAGVKGGVTTVVDGGSAGQAIFGGFPTYVVPASRTTVFCFLHIGSQGLSVTPEIRDWAEINLDATENMINRNRDLIKGIKVRLVGNIMASHGTEVIEIAKKVARKFGLPLMVHIGDVKKQVPEALTGECLQLMDPGDILIHIYTAKHGGILSAEGNVLPELKKAMQRGVILDVSHGRLNFSWEVARKCLAQGVLPDIISTDMSTGSINGPVYGLTVTLSKLLALGLDLKEVIKMATINPAKVLRVDDRKGSLKPGMDADISILESLSGTWQLEDSEQQVEEVGVLLVPRLTVKSGRLISAELPTLPQLASAG